MIFSHKINGVVIENKDIDFQNNQISVKLHNLSHIPNDKDSYNISFAGMRGYHALESKGIPDENDILTFVINRNDYQKVTIGTRAKISPVRMQVFLQTSRTFLILNQSTSEAITYSLVATR